MQYPMQDLFRRKATDGDSAKDASDGVPRTSPGLGRENVDICRQNTRSGCRRDQNVEVSGFRIRLFADRAYFRGGLYVGITRNERCVATGGEGLALSVNAKQVRRIVFMKTL